MRRVEPREGGQVFLVQLLLVAAILVIAAAAVAMSLRVSAGALAQEEQARAEGLAQQGVAQVLYELTQDSSYRGGPVQNAARFWPLPPPAGTSLTASSSACSGNCTRVTIAACADDRNWPASPSAPVGFAIYEKVRLSHHRKIATVLVYRQYAVPISAGAFGGFCSNGGSGSPP